MSYNANTARLAELKRDLELCRQAIRDVLEGGQSYTISGGISVSHPSLGDLRKQEADLQRQIITYQQSTRGLLHQRTAPDFTVGYTNLTNLT